MKDFVVVFVCLFLVFAPAVAGMDDNKRSKQEEIITLGGGCFWCIEPMYKELKGVKRVQSGYSGGSVKNPSYEQVCTGKTGHAEVIQVWFDPQAVTLKQLLEIFFTVHDPTTLNRQGSDVGPQYRSIILHRDPEQEATARQVMKEIQDLGIWNRPLVTEILPFEVFYKAEDYHQNYFQANPTQMYCRMVIAPKVAKFRAKFKAQLK
jgi:peptide-methionine (S)-S-oxide reductase